MISLLFESTSRFYTYQKARFPIIILALSLFPAILSSGAVVSSHPSMLKAIMTLVASIAYLLHIRVIDEYRDFNHDNAHHRNRPVQIGIISREELGKIDILAIVVLLGIALLLGFPALTLVALMLFYSYLAGKEFFLGENIRKLYFFYNSANLVQMVLLQFFVYMVFTSALSANKLLLFHFFFTTIGTVIFEFMRKLKIPGGDGTGRDTYTWYLGFSNSILLYVFLAFLNIFLFLKIITFFPAQFTTLLIFSGFLGTIISSFALLHWIKKKLLTEQLLQLSFLLVYIALNIIIYFTVLH